jgi:hypothetical protein
MYYSTKLILYSLFLFAFYSCRENQKQAKQVTVIIKGDHLVDAFGKVSFHTSIFRKLNCGLYINNAGVLGYKAIDNSLKFDSIKSLEIFLTTVYNDDSDSPGDDIREMRFVVDTATFEILPTGNFVDKNYFYRFNSMSDGGTIGFSKKKK